MLSDHHHWVCVKQCAIPQDLIMGKSDFMQNVVTALVYAFIFGFGVMKTLQWMNMHFRHHG